MNDHKPHRLRPKAGTRWVRSSWTKQNFAVYRVRSPCTVPHMPWRWAMWPARCNTPGGRYELIPEDDHPSALLRTSLWRGAAAVLLGLASWTSGDLEAAHRTYADGIASVQKAGHISDAIGCAIALADIRIAQGRLREAMSTYQWGLQLATAQGTPVLRGTADMYVGMSEIYRERGDLTAAMQHLLSSKELGEHTGLPQNRYRWCVAMARIREAEGDLTGALDLLQEAERLYVSDYSPNVRPVAAFKTRVWVAQGRLGEALGWARAAGPVRP